MEYKKKPLSFKEQADLLISRGLNCEMEELEKVLMQINYYRFGSYLHPYYKLGLDKIKPGTTLEMVLYRYDFDRELRGLILSALDIIEIAILRTQLVENFTRTYDPFCYLDPNCYKSVPDIKRFLNRLKKNINREKAISNKDFIKRFLKNYPKSNQFPMWMVVQLLSFGDLKNLYYYLQENDAKKIANYYSVSHKILYSWLHTLNKLRNACAHHDRVWNKNLYSKPAIPFKKNRPEFYYPKKIENNKIFAMLSIIQYLLVHIKPDFQWNYKVQFLLTKYSSMPIQEMGFPKNWMEYEIWQVKELPYTL